jgi:hypothetical protein
MTTKTETDAPFIETIRDKYRRYSTHILGFRHFAEGRDGLKPVQRRVLWSMNGIGATDKAHMTKVSKVSGDCFAAGTMVSTPSGPVAIETLKVGDVVTTSQGDCIVDAVFHNDPASPMIRIELGGGAFIVCTLDQEIKIRVGDRFFWKPARLLTEDDEIVCEQS